MQCEQSKGYFTLTRVLAEKVISVVLPFSIHTDASARITRASTRGHSRWKQLARLLARV